MSNEVSFVAELLELLEAQGNIAVSTMFHHGLWVPLPLWVQRISISHLELA